MAQVPGGSHGQDYTSFSSSVSGGSSNKIETGPTPLARASLADHLERLGGSARSQRHCQAYRHHRRDGSPSHCQLQSLRSRGGLDRRERRQASAVYDVGRRASVFSPLFQPSRARRKCHRRGNPARLRSAGGSAGAEKHHLPPAQTASLAQACSPSRPSSSQGRSARGV